ncbi:MAG: shikimate dehydrogenase [Bdellovibrionota bacterium]
MTQPFITTDWDQLSYPRLCGLIAERPTKLSQAMHNAGFQAAQLPFVYAAFDISKTGVAIQAMRDLKIRGFSVTIPHKETALQLVDVLHPDARAIGAINTVVNSGTKLYGLNTDWIGIRDALAEQGCDVRNKHVVVFGAGGAARAAIFAMQRLGAARILICNRSVNRAQELASAFGTETCSLDELSRNLQADVSLIINCTPLGSALNAGENPLVPLVQLLQCGPGGAGLPAVFDMVTRPTPLTTEAQKRGCNVIFGARMLLHQAFEQFRLFTEKEPPKEAMELALQRELSPGSSKA